MNILYISYDGMTDPLGQSQVIPYLKYLSGCGHHITVLSAEKRQNFNRNAHTVSRLLNEKAITWQYIRYSARPPVFSTIWDVYKLKSKALKLHRHKTFDIVHCRSYIAALAGLYLKRKAKLKFVFDMRGFWADERIDGGLWNLKNPVYKTIYTYFKNKEKEFIKSADYIVVLTEKARKIVADWQIKISNAPVAVIPCCVDTELFSPQSVNADKISEKQRQLGIQASWKIITYLGSLGTWYMPDEMMAFYKMLQQQKPEYRFMFITYDEPSAVYKLAAKQGVAPDRLIIVKASREEVPLLLSITDIALFFIKPVFSKKASSPTKQAELMSMGVPVICNDGIGDTTEIILQNKAGAVIMNFTPEAYTGIINAVDKLCELNKEHIRNAAERYFSLEKGGEIYNKIYMHLKDVK
ncbi:MAG: D-inositol-3-phosphate glycosyltransferase [Bacteroidetes bacterium ADurb.Bin408]|nr:MAG: D-inositol-3-phosphate glycosyltransferase [Bacteroidetes bacterium ADurb.Bin408]